MTSPQTTLSNVAATSQTYEYKYRQTDSNYYYYDRWVTSTQTWANQNMIWGSYNKSNAIKVGKTQGHADYQTWIDVESASTNYMSPHTVSENGANIELKGVNSIVFYAFINPYYVAPTNSESINQPSGSLSYDVPTSEITWTIDSDSPSSNATDTYAISGPNGYVQPLSHINGSTSSAGITSATTSLAGYWILSSTYLGTYITLDTLTIGGSNPPTSSIRKVSCNFW